MPAPQTGTEILGRETHCRDVETEAQRPAAPRHAAALREESAQGVEPAGQSPGEQLVQPPQRAPCGAGTETPLHGRNRRAPL